MNVVESRRSRFLVVRAEPGDELPQGALSRALDEAEARAGFIQGSGVLEAVELTSIAPARGRVARRIEGPVTVVTLSGSIATEDGGTSVRLSGTFVREGELGLETFGGEIVAARVVALDLFVTVFDDISLTRQVDDRRGLASLHATARAAASALRPVVTEAQPPRAPTPAQATAPAADTPQMPTRPMRPSVDVEFYPEVGDLVSHFHFGECEVLSSDGEHIRLRQEKDGRVREVSLTMLKIEEPTVDPASGKRHFRLARKH
jgi:predicted DNA-binding protein with PD1-like motif